MIRSGKRSAFGSRILAALSCGVFIASPALAQQGLSDWQSTPTTNEPAPTANWSSTPPGSYLPNKSNAKKSSGTKSSAPPLRTDDFSSDFSSKGQGLSGWQGAGSSNSSSGQSSGGSQGLSGWQGGGGNSNSGFSSGGSQGLSGWQGGGGNSNSGSSSNNSQGLSGWQGSGDSSGASAGAGSSGLSGWQTGGSGATLGDVLQQEQSMGGSAPLQGGVERDRMVNSGGNTMGGGMPDMNGMAGGNGINPQGGLNNPMGGMGQGQMNPGMGGMPGMPGGMGGLGGALGGMGGAAGLMEVLSNIMPKRQTPGTVTGGVNHTYFGTRSRGPHMLTGVPKTVNRAVNRNLKRGINTAAARATNMGLRRLRF
jgi:hypothetical protein